MYDEERLSSLELENEAKDKELSIEQKKALIAEAKKRYGKDWKNMLGGFKSGMDWSSLKFKLS